MAQHASKRRFRFRGSNGVPARVVNTILTAGLRINRYTQTGDVWYWIDAAFEGRGPVSRAVTILLDQAFGPFGLARVTVHTEAANQRSRALAARLGFTEEGLHRQAIAVRDQPRDEVVLRLARE